MVSKARVLHWSSLPILVLLAVAGNYFKFTLFFSVDFIFGSIFVFLIIHHFGLLAGVIAAALASSWTFFLWGHPWAITIFTAEALVVGLLKRGSPDRELTQLDALYWMVLGMPLVMIFYHGVMEMPLTAALIIMCKQALNGIFNALLASVLICHTPLGNSRQKRPVPLKTVLFHLSAGTSLCLLMVLLAYTGRSEHDGVQTRAVEHIQTLASEAGLLAQLVAGESAEALGSSERAHAALEQIGQRENAGFVLESASGEPLYATEQAASYAFYRENPLQVAAKEDVSLVLPSAPGLPKMERQRLGAYMVVSRLPDQPYQIRAFVSAAPYRQGLFEQHALLLGMGLVFTFLMMIIVAGISRRLVSPLEKIAAATAQIPDNLDRVPAKGLEQGGTVVEFQALSTSIAVMDKLLVEKFREIREVNETLERRVEERTHDLAAAREQLISILGSMEDLVWSIDGFDGGSVRFRFVNSAAQAMLGIKPAALMHDSAALYSVIHPEDRGHFLAQLERAHSTGSGEFGFRILHPESGERFLESRLWRIDDIEGRTSRIDGLTRDMTETRRDQEQLRLLALVTAKTDNAVVVTDASGQIEWVNSAFSEMTGYSAEEITGATPGVLLQGPLTDPGTVAYLREQIQAQQPFQAELINYHRKGFFYWVQVDGQPIFDEQGTLRHFVAIQRNTTERRRRLEIARTISSLQTRFMEEDQVSLVFDDFLHACMQFTDSHIGYWGRFRSDTPSVENLELYSALTGDWAQERFISRPAAGTMKRWFTEVEQLTQGQSPDGTSVALGINPSNDELQQILYLPVRRGETIIGMILLAGGHEGYGREILDALHGFQTLAATFIEVHRVREQRAREKLALGASEARLRAIFDSVIDAVITVNAAGHIDSFNPAAETLFGYRAREIIGRDVTTLMPDLQHDQATAYMRPFLDNGKTPLLGTGREVNARRKDGGTFPVELSISEMVIAGQRMFTGVVRDITERKRLEKMKNEFVSTVSHELRTPLTSIRGALGLMKHSSGASLAPEKLSSLLEVASRNSERLTILIDDLLDVQRIESGLLELSPERHPVSALLSACIEDMQGYAHQFGVSLELHAAEEADVLVDGNRFQQVLVNLISNAIKFSPGGGLVRVSLHDAGQGLRIEVQDEGAGIPEAFQPRLFERFCQGDGSTKRATPGSGLGLWIAKRLTEAMGGKIGFRTSSGKGTTFFLEFSLADQAGEGQHSPYPSSRRLSDAQ